MKTILSVVRFFYQPATEMQALVERNVGWGEIAAVLFVGIILSVVALTFDYPALNLTRSIFLVLLIVLGILIIGSLSYGFSKLFRGKGTLKNHLAALSWVAIPTGLSIVFSVVMINNDTSSEVLALVAILGAGIVGFLWIPILILSSIGAVHEFSKFRAFLASISTATVILGISLILKLL